MSFDKIDKLFIMLMTGVILVLVVLFSLVIYDFNNQETACEDQGLKFSGGKCYEHSGSRVITYELERESVWQIILNYNVNKFPSVEQ